MIWYAEQNIQLRSAEGTSGESSICVPTSAGCFIGDNIMNCVICKNQIPKENWWRKPKYCCWECYQIAHRVKREKRICLFCKGVFAVQRCIRKNYCSKECRHASRINIGHRYVGKNGYWYIKVSSGKYELEHRIIAESILKRPLTDKENVHHINGIKTDNSPENIRVFESNSAHVKHHAQALNWGVKYLRIGEPK